MIGRLVRVGLVFSALSCMDFVAAQMYPPGADERVPGEELYRACGFCHGAQGQGRQRLDAPALAGMEAWYVERQLHNLKERVRGLHPEDLPGLQMSIVTGMLRNDATIKNVAAYIETLTPGAPRESRPNGVLLPLERPFQWESQYAQLDTPAPGDSVRGQGAYDAFCALCHGAHAEGIEALGGNKLTDLPDWYLARQLMYFRDGVRGADPQDAFGLQMTAIGALVADDQVIADIIAHIGTL